MRMRVGVGRVVLGGKPRTNMQLEGCLLIFNGSI